MDSSFRLAQHSRLLMSTIKDYSSGETMICTHCNDELDPSDHNCCEACDLQDQLRARVAELERLIHDDAFAMTFQSMGQYRSALLKALKL
jgi:predicted amidophosphoribosyltransferase